ncbi:hypothetical protein BDZ45DRAFT_754848 [Acephala macrosclerotiorum]|nr:hypothetical protein BDZ45DRAFT_754848 [Acephala macrosclerotiorum]
MALARGLDDDHADFDNTSNWPRRLLHVPSMTSFRWQPENPLLIHGVPWEMPRVNPDTHFDVLDFKNVICEAMKTADRFYVFDKWKTDRIRDKTVVERVLRMFGGFLERNRWEYEFLGLDITCIDQRQSPIQMAEVGRQARIFRNAKHSYAWLSHLPHSLLKNLLSDLETAVSGLQQEPYNQEPSDFDSRRWISMAFRAISGLTSDPWFTSLWTLQEAFLCNHSILLSRDANVSCERSLIGPRSWTLNNLFKLPEHSQLLALIYRTGLAALWYNSPMGLLGVSNHRQATRELDYVYGIMQVFGSDFKVGNARDNVDHERIYSLSKLEDEFRAAILTSYPMLSQMHVYLTTPAFSKGWCVRGNSVVPSIVERGDMFS